MTTNAGSPHDRKRSPDGSRALLRYRGKIILIYSEDEKKIVATAPVDDSGNYRVSVAPGNYVLKMKLKGIQRAGNLPKEIVVNAGEAVEIDVEIDTGIR
ncbi:hypothetical protein IH970_05695 [candidate division KSB1 bacterium]|nr:hypothetical protein [candidate division KSB1 bacterium]